MMKQQSTTYGRTRKQDGYAQDESFAKTIEGILGRGLVALPRGRPPK